MICSMGNLMKIMIDTHIFLWAISDPKKIDKTKIKYIQSLSNTIFLSSISVAEIMIKTSIGRLSFDYNPVDLAIDCGMELLDFTSNDAILLKELPFFHKDPFDRMLICQSINNKYPIITDDVKFSNYDCKLI